MDRLTIIVTFKMDVLRDDELSLEDDILGWKESILGDPHEFIDQDKVKMSVEVEPADVN